MSSVPQSDPDPKPIPQSELTSNPTGRQGPTSQPTPKRKRPLANATASICLFLGFGLIVEALHDIYAPNKNDDSPMGVLVMSIPLFFASLAWFVGGRDEEVEKIIRREVVSSLLALAFFWFAVTHSSGKIHDSIQNGALSLISGAVVISSIRALIEAIHIRVGSWKGFQRFFSTLMRSSRVE